jgi:hypothetical protein
VPKPPQCVEATIPPHVEAWLNFVFLDLELNFVNLDLR